MNTRFARETALAALQQYNKEAFHIQHALTVEKAMRWFACDLGSGGDADFWGMVGLLLDIDFEMRFVNYFCLYLSVKVIYDYIHHVIIAK